jgi:hypothetical protein
MPSGHHGVRMFRSAVIHHLADGWPTHVAHPVPGNSLPTDACWPKNVFCRMYMGAMIVRPGEGRTNRTSYSA